MIDAKEYKELVQEIAELRASIKLLGGMMARKIYNHPLGDTDALRELGELANRLLESVNDD